MKLLKNRNRLSRAYEKLVTYKVRQRQSRQRNVGHKDRSAETKDLYIHGPTT